MMMRVFATICAVLLLATTATAYTQADRDAAIEKVKGMGMPHLKAFDRMTPKMLVSVLEMYTRLMSPGALEYYDTNDLEIIFAATSAINNCELCMSFHAMVLGNPENPGKLSAADIGAIPAGGLPEGAH